MSKTTTPDPKALQAQLDEANDQLDQPMEEGSAEHHRFLGLLDEIAQSHSALKDANAPMEAKLTADLKTFQDRLPPRYADHWHTVVSDI